ncbi:MAG: hypothetical protein LBP33_03490 [Candidatus Adiutrix sp.]|nr:hypothetical protein [Candidatus Adiutrix sp.]
MAGSTGKEVLGHLNRDRQATKALEASELNAEREASLLKTLAFLRKKTSRRRQNAGKTIDNGLNLE